MIVRTRIGSQEDFGVKSLPEALRPFSMDSVADALALRFPPMPAELLLEAAQCPTVLDRPADLRHVYKEEIARALDIICRDSRAFPDRYLQETTVPHGGE
jgi:hypothetical protein